MTEDEMIEWHHWLNGQEYKQAPGVGDGQGSLAYYSPWGGKESDMTEQQNWTEQHSKHDGHLVSNGDADNEQEAEEGHHFRGHCRNPSRQITGIKNSVF